MVDPDIMLDYDAIAHKHPYRCLTSKLAWESVRNSGWINKCSKIVYQIFCAHGPITLTELEHIYAGIVGTTPKGRSESNAVRRFCELKAAGLVEQHGIKMCPHLKKLCNTYKPSNAVAPKDKPKLPEFVVLWEVGGNAVIFSKADGSDFKDKASKEFNSSEDYERMELCRVFKTTEKEP